mgnify:CR=1 FL=1
METWKIALHVLGMLRSSHQPSENYPPLTDLIASKKGMDATIHVDTNWKFLYISVALALGLKLNLLVTMLQHNEGKNLLTCKENLNTCHLP